MGSNPVGLEAGQLTLRSVLFVDHFLGKWRMLDVENRVVNHGEVAIVVRGGHALVHQVLDCLEARGSLLQPWNVIQAFLVAKRCIGRNDVVHWFNSMKVPGCTIFILFREYRLLLWCLVIEHSNYIGAGCLLRPTSLG